MCAVSFADPFIFLLFPKVCVHCRHLCWQSSCDGAQHQRTENSRKLLKIRLSRCWCGSCTKHSLEVQRPVQLVFLHVLLRKEKEGKLTLAWKGRAILSLMCAALQSCAVACILQRDKLGLTWGMGHNLRGDQNLRGPSGKACHSAGSQLPEHRWWRNDEWSPTACSGKPNFHPYKSYHSLSSCFLRFIGKNRPER